MKPFASSACRVNAAGGCHVAAWSWSDAVTALGFYLRLKTAGFENLGVIIGTGTIIGVEKQRQTVGAAREQDRL